MDIYILDLSYQPRDIVDVYISFIWTERYNEVGDFELVLHDSPSNRTRFTSGTKLHINGSDRVMIVETLETAKDDDGNATITVTGRSLEFILDNRAAMAFVGPENTSPKIVLTGFPQYVVTELTKQVIYDPVTHAGDGLDYFNGCFEVSNGIAWPNEEITFESDMGSLLDAIQNICAQYKLGFRIRRGSNQAPGELPEYYLVFECYVGKNRTNGQTAVPPVIFSERMDTLSSVKELTSIADYKNVAYVIGNEAVEIVYANNVEESVKDFDRRVIFVDGTDVDLPIGAELTAALTQKGKEELAKHRPVIVFDGEVSQNGKNIYNTDYELGDLVEMHSLSGYANRMLVTEQIFISDSEGIRSYPTLTVDLLITPGSWFSRPGTEVWDDVEEYWDDV